MIVSDPPQTRVHWAIHGFSASQGDDFNNELNDEMTLFSLCTMKIFDEIVLRPFRERSWREKSSSFPILLWAWSFKSKVFWIFFPKSWISYSSPEAAEFLYFLPCSLEELSLLAYGKSEHDTGLLWSCVSPASSTLCGIGFIVQILLIKFYCNFLERSSIWRKISDVHAVADFTEVFSNHMIPLFQYC